MQNVLSSAELKKTEFGRTLLNNNKNNNSALANLLTATTTAGFSCYAQLEDVVRIFDCCRARF